jgi:hypothetical protein
MKFWIRLAELVPTGRAADEIASARAGMKDGSGDRLALSHAQLFAIYSREAVRKPLLAIPLRYLAKHHLAEAVVSAEAWPAPLAMLGGLQLEHGNLWGSLKNLSKFIEKQRVWMELSPVSDDSERLELCRQLVRGGTVRCRLGQYAPAREWFSEAYQELARIDTKSRSQQQSVEDNAVTGISGCLILEFKYAEADRFIGAVLADDVFSTYRSPAHRQLLVSRELIGGLPETTRDFAPVPSTAGLWGELIEDVERCESPEAAREVRKRILETIRTHALNAEIRDQASKVEAAMRRQLSAAKSALSETEVPAATLSEEADLSAISSPKLRKELEDMRKATRATMEGLDRINKDLHETTRKIFEASEKLGEQNIAAVQELAKTVYRIPFRYHAEWMLWSMVRFAVQIGAVAFFLEKILVDSIFEGLLKEQGGRLFETISPARKELIILGVVLLAGFVLGHFAEKRIDRWMLPRYKRLLFGIVSDRSTKVWTTYNFLVKLLAQSNQDLIALEKQLAVNFSEAPPA